MNAPSDLMATAWWDGLTAAERDRWLDAAQSAGRDRTLFEAYAIRRDIQTGAPVLRTYRTQCGLYAGHIITDGKTLFGVGAYATTQEVRRAAEEHGFADIPVLYAQYLADVPGFGLDDEQDPTHGLTR